jgi:type IV secretion system protein VirB11
MNAPLRHIYLDSYLALLAPWLDRADVTDIYINRPGELWFETLGAEPQRCDAPELTEDILARLVRQIAAVSAQGVNREHPLLAASLPTGERVQAGVALAVRKHVSAGMVLDDYRSSGATETTQLVTAGDNARVPIGEATGDPLDLLRKAVQQRRNILISGGTSSGKTTFVNALLKEIPRHERLILIEDTPELQIVHENAVGLIAARGEQGEAEVNADDLLIASLRMRPDRIILGEIRGAEAITFLRSVNTGHPGSISTIHADSPARAIDQLALLVMQTGTRMAWEDVVKYVRNSLDIIVQLRRVGGKRDIESIMVIE